MQNAVKLKQNIMNANEARRISDENKQTLEGVLGIIDGGVKHGANEIILYHLSNEVVVELMKLEYKMTMHKDTITGTTHHICSF